MGDPTGQTWVFAHINNLEMLRRHRLDEHSGWLTIKGDYSILLEAGSQRSIETYDTRYLVRHERVTG